jgi:AcrR family transcriptional regulator
MISMLSTSEASEGRRTRRRRELHQSILATAAELFARDGYDATTVEKIAAAADIVPATFFNHFRSKEDVLREVGQDVFSRFRRLIDEQLVRPVTSTERLDGFARRSAALVRHAPEMTRRVLMAVLRSPRLGESSAEIASLQADFAQLLRRGRDDAAPARDVPHDLDIELAAEILVSVVIGTMTHWINDPDYPLESGCARRCPCSPTVHQCPATGRRFVRQPRTGARHPPLTRPHRPRGAHRPRGTDAANEKEDAMKTEICKRLGIEFPIFAFSHCRDVVAAVSNAGGFGVLGAVGFSAEQLRVELDGSTSTWLAATGSTSSFRASTSAWARWTSRSCR